MSEIDNCVARVADCRARYHVAKRERDAAQIAYHAKEQDVQEVERQLHDASNKLNQAIESTVIANMNVSTPKPTPPQEPTPPAVAPTVAPIKKK